MAELEISFRNKLKKTNFNGMTDCWLAPAASFSKLPDKVLKALDGQMISVTTSFWGGYAAARIACWWYDPVTKARFGVKIHAGPQPADIGWRPTWQIMYDHNDLSVDPVWIDSGTSPASNYTWDKSIGFSIEAEPTSGDYTLSIIVTIQALS